MTNRDSALAIDDIRSYIRQRLGSLASELRIDALVDDVEDLLWDKLHRAEELVSDEAG